MVDSSALKQICLGLCCGSKCCLEAWWWGGELVGWRMVVSPTRFVGGRLDPEGAILYCGTGRGIHFCELLQGLEPVWRTVVLKRVQTVATGGWNTCREQDGSTLRYKHWNSILLKHYWINEILFTRKILDLPASSNLMRCLGIYCFDISHEKKFNKSVLFYNYILKQYVM